MFLNYLADSQNQPPVTVSLREPTLVQRFQIVRRSRRWLGVQPIVVEQGRLQKGIKIFYWMIIADQKNKRTIFTTQQLMNHLTQMQIFLSIQKTTQIIKKLLNSRVNKYQPFRSLKSHITTQLMIMNWKPDSIEEFVRYKIEHPEQSFITFKNYEAEKKHNEHIDQLYKELNKYRSELNHFKSELFKLNQVTTKELETNGEEVKRIDERINGVGEKMHKAKGMVGVGWKERKRMLIEEYEQQIRKIEGQWEQWQFTANNNIEQIRTKLVLEIGENKREAVIERINKIRKEIDEKVKGKQERNDKIQKVNQLTERQNHLKLKVSDLTAHLRQQKSIIQQAQKTHHQAQYTKAVDTTCRLSKFKTELITLYQPFITQQSISLSQLLPVDTQPNIYRQRKWNQMKEEFSQGVQGVREYVKRVEYYSEANFGQIGEVDEDSKEQSKKYLEEFGIGDEINKVQQELTYKDYLKMIAEKVQKIKLQASGYYENEEKQLKKKEVELDSKEKQLDKEITQLQTKVTKTDNEISKFLKYK